MGIVVMKFGGTSVADAEKIRAAARRAIRTQKTGHQVVMVVSAMGKETNRLEDLARQISSYPAKREMDQLLSTGEQVTISLMAMALEEMGARAISMTAGQMGIITDEAHTKARIHRIDIRRVHKHLDAGRIVIAAGFQGITETGAVTTLGRGGSNVTLVAIAAALEAEICENFTDVDGIYTADPRIVPNARKIEKISYDEMLELASLGVKVLHNRAVEFAEKYDVPLHVRNSQHNRKGTLIVHETESMERIVVRGAALKEGLARVTLTSVPNRPGVVAKIFHQVARYDIMVDDIIQTTAPEGEATISFTVEMGEVPEARKVINNICRTMNCTARFEHDLAKVSAVGVGMRTHTGVAERMFAALAKANINIQNITTSEIRISCLIDRRQGKKALRVVHDAFELGGKRRRKAKKAPSGKARKTAKKRAGKKTTRKK